jgi:hypothetical protein
MTPKERSEEIQQLADRLNLSLAEAADEGLEVWVRTMTNQRIEAAPIAVVSVSITKRAEANG